MLVLRNEERFLREHLAWHRAVGVERFYAFLDRCTDATAQIVAGADDVEVRERDRGEEHAWMSAYQTERMDEALALAAADGFDWLLHVDADEFARGGGPGGDPAERDALPRLCARADRWASRLRTRGRRVDQVILRPSEAVPERGAVPGSWAERAWFQDGGALERDVLDPADGRVRRLDHLIGASRGKSLVRIVAGARAASAHHWTAADGSPLATRRDGLHHHYVVTDAAHWREKYRKFAEYPDHWQKGNAVQFPKQAWKEASTRLSDDEAAAYFERWVAADPALLVEGPHLVHDPTIRDFVRGLGLPPLRPAAA